MISATVLPIETLRNVPLLAQLQEPELRQLAEIATSEHYPAGETILRQGKISQNLWVVLTGICEVCKQVPGRNEVVLAELQQYQSFGEMSFFDEAPHSASVRAKTSVTLLRITRPAFEALLENPGPAANKLALNVVRTLADRLRRMDDWVLDLVTNNPPNKAEKDREWGRFQAKLFGHWHNV